MKREIVEKCKTCLKENIFKDWDIDSQGYMAKCQHCGHSIMLCDECMHADDNPKHICDFQSFCFRGELKHGTKSDVITCGECIFYTPKPEDPLMGKCNYKNRKETVFEDDFCSRAERS